MAQPEPVNLVKHDAELAGEKLVIITLRHDDASLIRHDDASLIFFLDRNKSQGLIDTYTDGCMRSAGNDSSQTENSFL